RPKIHQRREQAVAHADTVVGNRAANLSAVGRRVKQGELEVVQAAGRAAVVLELALVGEGRALGAQTIGDRQETQREQKQDKFFHKIFRAGSKSAKYPIAT